jgi:hypothetical protein
MILCLQFANHNMKSGQDNGDRDKTVANAAAVSSAFRTLILTEASEELGNVGDIALMKLVQLLQLGILNKRGSITTAYRFNSCSSPWFSHKESKINSSKLAGIGDINNIYVHICCSSLIQLNCTVKKQSKHQSNTTGFLHSFQNITITTSNKWCPAFEENCIWDNNPTKTKQKGNLFIYIFFSKIGSVGQHLQITNDPIHKQHHKHHFL